ncbi:unnamed protein product [Arabis nemorensis]|uniref:Uncharacterized protein n=1 Tax=Arabis nemorensis TaxID=586526 RepID=A0A565BQS1_9BRAS|nr:unnamed protein product [Arabis nemorensis]
MIWPPKELCSSCYLSSSQKKVEWDEDHVYKFLKNYYGPKLVSLYKEKNVMGSKKETISATEDLTVATNAMVVPIGAALAIAIASCAFGALACYWRTQQKNRKYLLLSICRGEAGIEQVEAPDVFITYRQQAQSLLFEVETPRLPASDMGKHLVVR